MERLYTAIPNARLIVADVEAGTPDGHIRKVFEVAAEVSGTPVAHLVPQQDA